MLLASRAFPCPFFPSQMCILLYESYSSLIDHSLYDFYCIKAACVCYVWPGLIVYTWKLGVNKMSVCRHVKRCVTHHNS